MGEIRTHKHNILSVTAIPIRLPKQMGALRLELRKPIGDRFTVCRNCHYAILPNNTDKEITFKDSKKFYSNYPAFQL